jgi:phosphatidylglycerophosphatase C
MREAPSLVVFDFDGTLVHGDSVTGFAVDYLLHRPVRLLCLLPSLPFALLLMLVGPTRSLGVTLFWWLLTFGTRTRPLAEALRDYSRTTLSERGNAATLAAFTTHLGQGDLVVVATAAPALVVHQLLRARGVPGARVVGTRLRRRFGGLVASPHCIGITKVHELERRHGFTHWAEVYSDSALDLPLMLRANAVTLVAPNRRARARIGASLAAGVPVRVIA